ncbi:hypothetical protein BH10PSE6_BH10PSE6_06570 [soil metagenome]
MAKISGTNSNNLLIGTPDDDEILGLGGNDELRGLGGNDTLNGGDGDDLMLGGLGDDRYIVDSALDVPDETGGAGVDTIISRISYTLADNFENLELIGLGPLNGTGNTLDNRIEGNDAANTLDGGVGNDLLRGRGGNDLLIGGAGGDVLVGGLGADAMFGGTGKDQYFVDNAGDVVTDIGSGQDQVNSTVDFTLSQVVENLTLRGTGDIDGTGNASKNRMIGNTGNNELRGLGGDDVLNGRQGNDTLEGGDGNDTLLGETGNDNLTGGAGVDVLNGGTGNDVMDVGDGDGGDRLVFGPGSGDDLVHGFDNSVAGNHDLIDVSAFGYTDFQDFTAGGGLITPNLVGGLLTSYTVQFSFAGESAVINVTNLLGPAISPSDFVFA